MGSGGGGSCDKYAHCQTYSMYHPRQVVGICPCRDYLNETAWVGGWVEGPGGGGESHDLKIIL